MLSAEECLAKYRELEACGAATDEPAYKQLAEYWRVVAALATWQEKFVQSNGPLRLN
jgi:hypothetical protein